MPPLPKPNAARRANGRHRKPGAAVLRLPDGLDHVPEEFRTLPATRSWAPSTVEWWAELVRSPMATEWHPLDWHGLTRVAALIDVAATSDDLAAVVKALAEVRLQGACYGLTPADRARLHWELERGDRATRARAQRRDEPAPSTRPDPRLRAVSRPLKGS